MNICAILLNYRGAEKTIRCLESLVGQGLSTVIIVDNSDNEVCSGDLRKSIEKLDSGNLDYRIRLVTAQENLGFAKGINFAISNDRESSTSHDYYLVINNDATAQPGLVAKLHQALLNDDDILLTAPCIKAPETEEECGLWYNRYLGLLTKNRTPLSFRYVSGCCMMVDKCLATGNRLFDPGFFMYCEDAFLCWKLARQEQGFRLVTDALVMHDVGASSQKAKIFYEYHTARGHVLMAVKAFKSPLEVPLMLIPKLLTLSLRSVVRCIRYKSLVPAYALLLACYPLNIKVSNP
jgi:GT2 family glycosyltransferase